VPGRAASQPARVCPASDPPVPLYGVSGRAVPRSGACRREGGGELRSSSEGVPKGGPSGCTQRVHPHHTQGDSVTPTEQTAIPTSTSKMGPFATLRTSLSANGTRAPSHCVHPASAPAERAVPRMGYEGDSVTPTEQSAQKPSPRTGIFATLRTSLSAKGSVTHRFLSSFSGVPAEGPLREPVALPGLVEGGSL
jgi:hypothetical protein